MPRRRTVPRRVLFTAGLVYCSYICPAWSATRADRRASIASFAAQAALDALDGAAELSELLRQVELAGVSASQAGPLDAYRDVDSLLGRWLESLLSGARHVFAAHAVALSGVVATPDELSILASLDQQLSALLTVHRQEPLFYWHGPKHLIRALLRRAFDTPADGGSTLQQRLAAQAADDAWSASTVANLVSLDAAEEKFVELGKRQSRVPIVGIALGDAECGGDVPCDYGSALQAAKERSDGRVHVLVRHSTQDALVRIRAVIDSAGGGVYVSFLPAQPRTADDEAPGALAQRTRAVLATLGLARFDLLWLPHAATWNHTWPQYKATIDMLVREGTISSYGVFAQAISGSSISHVCQREPAPLAWLFDHDVLRPCDEGALEAARGAGDEVIALPRIGGLVGGGDSAYVNALVGADPAAQDAAILSWVLGSGMAVVARPRVGRPSLAKVLPLVRPVAGMGLLRILGVAARPEAPPMQEAAPTAPDGLQEAIAEGRRLAAIARAEKPLAGELSARSEASPAIRAETLAGMQGHQRAWKDNNHIIYADDFFDNMTMALIRKEVQRLWKSEDVDANCNLDGRDRVGGYVLDHLGTERPSSLYSLIYGNEPLRRWVSTVNGQGEMWPSDFPIELREYGEESRGMMCHPDLQMYHTARKDSEFAFTVDNPSACMTTFRDAHGEQHEIHSKGNGLIMVRPNAAEHCVGPTRGGTRTILKFIYVGDYRKSRAFWPYTTNACSDSNPNRRILSERRSAPGKQGHSDEL